ncbi:MAG: NAD(P)/FAD-dependent oxidoreductase [Candidatus Thermoplasmatota archaeon]|nr:NAD(P)/FAD-dependent oxidoreductase [Candidatus Thermoplasmatota archaeon]
MRWDVIVVGGGPVGSLTARHLARRGFRTLVVEEDAAIGTPVRCAGLVTPRVLQLAGAGEEAVVNAISGARVHAPDGTVIHIGGNKTHALVIDRAAFDAQLADMAEAAGTVYRCSWRATAIHLDGKKRTVKGRETLHADFLVGADGAHSLAARMCGAGEPKKLVCALQTVARFNTDENTVEVFMGNHVAPGFFAWVVPEGRMARIGLGVAAGHSVRHYFDKLVRRLGVTPGRVTAGLIPLGLRTPLARRGMALVGDAAGQVKPTSGGGLYPGLAGADLLASCLAAAPNDDGLLSYEKEYQRAMGKELKRGLFMHNRFAKLDDDKMNRIFAAIDDGVVATINDYGDIDHPSLAARALLKGHPSLVRFLLPF